MIEDAAREYAEAVRRRERAEDIRNKAQAALRAAEGDLGTARDLETKARVKLDQEAGIKPKAGRTA